MRTKELVKWIVERHSISEQKEMGKPKPWTKDLILQKYRFCNVYRELDTVTRWISTHWREKYNADPDLWFAMVVARLVNWPDTMKEIGFPVQWDKNHFIKVLADRKQNHEQVWGGAYIVSTNGHVMEKHKYIAEKVLSPMWKEKVLYRPRPNDHLLHFYTRLTKAIGMGSFMAAQVVADMKYARPLKDAPDWFRFAMPGPGSKRGMNRVMGRDKDASQRLLDWQVEITYLQDDVNKLVKKAGMEELHAQDLQNCLCEFDKYERVRLGEGKPKALYPGV